MVLDLGCKLITVKCQKMQVGEVYHLELWLLILLESLGVFKSPNAQAISQTN